MIPDFRDYREERDWLRPWREKPGLICCCVGGGGNNATSQLCYYGAILGVQAELYTVATDAWTFKTNPPSPTSGVQCGCYSIASCPYAQAGSSQQARNVRYNSGLNTWSTLANLGTSESEPAGVPLFAHGSPSTQQYGYLFDGAGLGGVGNKNQQYNVVADSWTNKTNTPTPMRFQQGYGVIGTKGYQLGGDNTTSSPAVVIGNVDEYDPIADSWASRTADPTPRRVAACFNIDTSSAIGIFSGSTSSGSTQLAETYAVDTWTTRTSDPVVSQKGCEIGTAGYLTGDATALGNSNIEYVIDTYTTKKIMTTGAQGHGVAPI